MINNDKSMLPLEKWHLLQFCKKNDIDTQEIDNTLTYWENKNHLIELIPSKEDFEIDKLQLIDNIETYQELIDILKEELTTKYKRNQEQILDKIIIKLKDFGIMGFDKKFLKNIVGKDLTLSVNQRISRLLKRSEILYTTLNKRAYFGVDYRSD
jgi:hypothetical protein